MKTLSVFTIFTSVFIASIFIFFNLLNQDRFILAEEKEVLGEKVIQNNYIHVAPEESEKKERKTKNIDIVYPVKKEGAVDFSLEASNAIVLDKKSGMVMYEKNADEKRPIASITKLMVALVFLDYNPGWETIYQMKAEDRASEGTVYLYLGEEVFIKDLFHVSLVGSDNTATKALISATELSEQEFVDKMNEKAQELNLNNTFFQEPTGLSSKNVSSARETAVFAMQALSKEEIRQATLNPEYEFTTIGGKKKKIPSTDYLLKNLSSNEINIIGGKTGYIESAGFCFIGEFNNNGEHELISVVLNSPNHFSRFYETKNLIEWTYANYEWRVKTIEILDF